MASGQPAVADHGVGGHADKSSGGPHAAAIGDVLEQGDGLVLGQLRSEEGRASAFGEPVAAGAAVQEPDVLVLAVAGADRQVVEATLAEVGATLVLAAEMGKVLVHWGTWLIRSWERE
jgi:hypothetical protein